jgi:probable HAF family extracellular repeat protein
MKSNRSISVSIRLMCFGLALALMTSSVWAQQHPAGQRQLAAPTQYNVVDLGTLGGTFSIAYGINDKGEIDGFSTIPGDSATHAFVAQNGVITDLGTLGGPNSLSYVGPSNAGQATGLAETSMLDPNGEDFCGFGTNLICLGFSWQNGIMTALDTLGGNNAQGGAINNAGQIAGYAENSTHDPNCPSPQVLEFKPVVWTNSQIQALPTYPGDPEGGAFWINDRREVVGASGLCAPYDGRYGVGLAPKHALLWRNGTFVVDLGSLGGTFNNAGFAINDVEQVVGASDLAGDQYQHAFFWQNGVMSDMGTLPGDVVSAALAINHRGQAVGLSQDASQNIRAFLWENGVMTDLNSLIPANSPLYLLHGYGINSSGEIVGFGATNTGEIHGFLAIPTHPISDSGSLNVQNGNRKSPLSENARKQLQRWVRFRLFVSEVVQ